MSGDCFGRIFVVSFNVSKKVHYFYAIDNITLVEVHMKRSVILRDRFGHEI